VNEQKLRRTFDASVHLRAAFAASGHTYGSRRLRSAWKRKFVHTTDSKHAMPVSPNVLARQFDRPLPNQARVCDIREAMTDVADYIVGLYNCERLHSKLGNLSPNAFERETATQQPIDVSEIT